MAPPRVRPVALAVAGVRGVEQASLHRVGRDGSVIADRTTAGASTADALAVGRGTAAWVMAVFSAAGGAFAVLMGRHNAARGTFEDAASAAAAHTHTTLTSDTATATATATAAAAVRTQ